MSKLIAIFCLMIVSGISVFAQTVSEYNKNEFFIGYSNQQVELDGRNTFNGFEGSYVRNISRYFGLKGDVSGAYRNDNFEFPIFVSSGVTTNIRNDTRSSLYNYLGGIQVKDNASKTRFKPFGHALIGVAQSRERITNTCSGNCTAINSSPRFNLNDTGFAAVLGGGLDIKINDKFDFRAIQVDYNPVGNFGNFNNNFRFGIGIVIK